MNIAVHFPVFRFAVERAMVQYTAIRCYPIIDAEDIWQIIDPDLSPVAASSVHQRYRDKLEDIVTVCFYPRENIFDNSLLVPPPFLTTATALHAVLIWCHRHFLGISWVATGIIRYQHEFTSSYFHVLCLHDPAHQRLACQTPPSHGIQEKLNGSTLVSDVNYFTNNHKAYCSLNPRSGYAVSFDSG